MDTIEELLTELRNTNKKQVKEIRVIPADKPVFSPGFDFPDPRIRQYLDKSGIKDLYTHQADAIKKIRDGKNIVITTPTASGKTLCFNIPVLEKTGAEENTRALYIYPAKALSNDQLNNLNDMKEKTGIDFEAGIYDGDTPSDKKKHIRENCNIVITNPYMLHQVLPYHPKWKNFYKNLKYIVLDESHKYRGIFGSNIGFLIRRLKRILKVYRAGPQFIISTASLANPLEFAEKLTGETFELINKSGSPRGNRHLVLWDSSKNPEKSTHTQTKDILLYTAKNRFQTLCFIISRRMAELIRKWANKEDKSVEILSYRAGYSPETRREIEQKLKNGLIQGVVSTEALELGIDIGQLDVIILSGYPGTISSFWQMAGRAGRKMQDSAIFFLPHEDALQKYLLKHPEVLTDMNFESAVISTENPEIIRGQILCAISETPAKTKEVFPGLDTEKEFNELIEHALISDTPRGYIYTGGKRPHDIVSLENIAARDIKIKVDGKILETMAQTRAFREAHTGAVHIHNGETYVIKEFNTEEGVAYASKEDVDYYTQAVKKEEVEIIKIEKEKQLNNFRLLFGKVVVTEKYTEYRMKKTGKVIGSEELHLPPLKFTSEAVWVELNDSIQADVEDSGFDFGGALHAAEHALIALSPLFAMCDPNDLGGYSYPEYGDEGKAVIFIYDAYEGGIGISKKLYEIFKELNKKTIEMVSGCGCETGCPSCVYSPMCGNNNNPIDKQGSIILLKHLG